MFGYIYLSASLAYVVGPLGGGQLADHSLVSWFSYATPYWTVTILLACTCVAVIVWFQETHQGSGEKGSYLESFTNLARVVTDRRLRPLYLVNFVLYLAIFGFFRVYPMYLVDEFHMGVGQVSEYVAFVAVPIVVANVWLVGVVTPGPPSHHGDLQRPRHGRADGDHRDPEVDRGPLVHVGGHCARAGDLPSVVRGHALAGRR